MKNKFRILKIFVTAILFGFLLSFSLKRFNDKPVEKVAVNLIETRHPVYFIDEKDIKDIVKKMNPTRRIGDLNIPELEKKLNQIPAVDSSNVYLDLNGRLNLDIKQRVPMFRLNNNGRDFYVDEKGTEFPISPNYSYTCMLVTGDVKKAEYQKLAELVAKIDLDAFSKKYFIGIEKENGSYNLLTSEGNYKVEIGDLDRIDFKVKGFKTFVEKYLVYQQPEKYAKISVRYDNQIVTTLNPNFEENDSILSIGNKELAKLPVLAEKKAQQVKLLNTTLPKSEPTKQAVKKMEQKPAEKAATPSNAKTTETKKTAIAQKKTQPTPKKPAVQPIAKKNIEPKVPTKPKGKVQIE